MVPSISFSGRECRHADKIFAFPARTEFSVTTGLPNQFLDVLLHTIACSELARVRTEFLDCS
jgi:hypothetical protein